MTSPRPAIRPRPQRTLIMLAGLVIAGSTADGDDLLPPKTEPSVEVNHGNVAITAKTKRTDPVATEILSDSKDTIVEVNRDHGKGKRSRIHSDGKDAIVEIPRRRDVTKAKINDRPSGVVVET